MFIKLSILFHINKNNNGSYITLIIIDTKAIQYKFSVLQYAHLPLNVMFINLYVHVNQYMAYLLFEPPRGIRAVAGQRSSPDLCFATKSIKVYDQ